VRRALQALLLGAGLLTTACGGAVAPTFRSKVLFAEDAPAGVTPYLGVPLQTGQILLSESPGPYTLLFVLSQQTYRPLTHAAIIVVDEVTGEPWVYEMAAEFKPVFASTMQEALEEGGMRRTPFFDFVAQNVHAEVVDPNPTFDRKALGRKVVEMYEARVAFDPRWDFTDRDALYCTEFVGVVYASFGIPMPALVQSNPNPSIQAFLEWFGVKAPTGGLPGGAFAENTRTVAVFSTWGNRAAALAHFEAKRELHRRFTMDQRLGNLLALDGMEMVIRPPVEAFLQRAPGLYPGRHTPDVPPPVEEVRAKVRALADEVLGPFPDAAPAAQAEQTAP
jgi:hypothetical protein